MKKKIYLAFVVVAMFLAWYIFIKPYDYTIRFTSKTFPYTINQTIKSWGTTKADVSETYQLDNIYNLKQTLKFGDSVHEYHWQIKHLTDSTSQVIVDIKDNKWSNSFWNKIEVPFSSTDFSKRSERTVLDFMNVLKDHVDNFKVSIVGIEDMPVKYLAYVQIEENHMGKASGMMKNYSFLSQVLLKNKLELDGVPMVEVTNWKRDKDSITFNFCYPIKLSDSLPKIKEVQYKQLKARKGIKAIYHGNYITSDRAWYALLDYAKENHLKVKEQPLEVFYNNPNMGGDALTWKTEVYLPLNSDK